MDGRRVVVLGGGVGGLTAANELRRLLGPQHRVVLATAVLRVGARATGVRSSV